METFRAQFTWGLFCATAALTACNDVPGKAAGTAGMPTSGAAGTPTSTSTTSSNTTSSTPTSSTSTSGSNGSGNGGSAGAGASGSGGLGGSGGSADDADSSMAGGAPDAATDGASDDGSFPPGATIGSCVSTKWTTSALASAVADPPVNAVDGVLVSRWSTGVAQTPGQYYQIDFGGYVRLTQIVLDSTGSAGDHPRGYQVETSA